MGDYDLHIDIYGNDSNFTSSLDNARKSIRRFVRDVEKDSEGIDKAFEKMSILKSLKGKIDLSNPKAELAKFDEQVRILLKNLDNYFASLQQRLNSITSVVDGKKITSGNASASQVADLQRQHAELMEMARKRQDELEQERAKYRQLAEAIRTNNIPVLHQLAQEEDAASKALRLDAAKNYVKDLNKDMQQLLEKMKDYQSDVEAYKATLEQLKSGGTVLSKDNSNAETIANVTKNLQEAEATLDKMKAEYNDMAAQQKQYSEQVQQSEGHHIRIRTQIMNAREEMMAMIAAGQQGTPAFQQLAEKVGQMRREMALANATMQYFADPNKNLTTLKVGLQGVAGAAGMVTGVIGLFNSENEKMAKIQTQVQSILSIIVGLQTTYNLVKKTGNVMLAIEEVKTWAVAKARGVQAAATGAATVAQEGLNAAMLKNPIGAILSLLAILGTAIYAVARAMMTETDAEKKAREEREAHIKAIRQQHEKWTESVAESASKQIISYNELKRKWNELGDDLKAKEKFVRDNKTAFQNLGFSINDVTDAESLLVKNTEAVVNAIMARARAIAYQEAMADNLKAQIKEQMTKTTRSGDYRYNYKAGNKISNKTFNDRYGKESGRNLLFGNDYTWEDGLIKLTEAGANKLAKLEDDRVKKAQEAKNKRIQTKKEEFDETRKLMEADYENQKKAAEQAGLQTYEGEKDEKRNKGGKSVKDDEAKKDAGLRAKRLQDEWQFQEELARIKRDGADAAADAAIAEEKNSAERERRQRQEEHQRTLRELEAQRDEIYKKIYDIRKAAYENANNGKKYEDTKEGKAGYIDSDARKAILTSATEKEKELITEFFVFIDNKQKEENAKWGQYVQERLEDEAKAMTSFLKQYGSFEEQRRAITKEYDAKISKEKNIWLRKQLEEEKKAALNAVNSSQMKFEINWEAVFGNIESYSKDALLKIREQLNSWIDSTRDDRTVEEMKELYEALEKINGAIQKKGGLFGGLKDALKNSKAALKELEKAKQDYEVNVYAYGLNSAQAQNAKGRLNAAQWNYDQSQQQVIEARNQMFDNMATLSNALKNLGEEEEASLSSVGSVVGSLINTLSSTNTTIGNLIAAILSLMEAIGKDGRGFFQNLFRNIGSAVYGVNDALNPVANAYREIHGDHTLLGKFFAADALSDNTTKDYDALREQYDYLLKVWDEIIAKKREYVQESWGIDAINAEREAIELLNKQIEAERLLADERLGAGGGYWSHSMGYRMWGGSYKDIYGRTWSDVAGEINGSLGVNLNSMQDFVNLTSDQLQWIKEHYSTLWASMDDQFREHLENIIKYGEEIVNATEEASKKLIGISKDEAFDSLRESLHELANGSEDTFEDIEKNYQKMLNKMVIDNLIIKELEKDFEDWYSKLVAVQEKRNETGGDYEYQQGLNQLTEEYWDIVEKGRQRVEQYRDLGIIQAVEEAESAFGNLRDTFLDTLTDMEDDAEAFRKRLEKIMVKDVIEKQVLDVPFTINGMTFDNFDAYIKSWNERYVTAVKSGNQEAIDALIDELVQARELTVEAAEQWRERLKEVTEDTSFEDMNESWVSTLMDMSSTAEDWSQNIGKVMVQRIVEQMIAPTMLKPLLEGLQGAFNTAMSAEGATWESVVNDADVQSWLGKIKEAFPEAQNLIKSIMESLGLITAEGLGDIKSNFVSALMDIEKSAEDLGKEIAKTMYEQMIEKFVDSKYGDELKALSDEWADALKSGDTSKIEEIRQKIIALYQAIGNDDAIRQLTDDLKELNDIETPFDNLRSSYLSAVMDMKKTTKDFTDDIMKMIAEAFVDSFVLGAAFDEKLKYWKEQYGKITSDESLSEKERLRQLKALGELIAGERDNMKAEANNIMTMLGLNQDDTESATMNMADKATYDQFELYLGIANAHLMVSEQHKQISQEILTTLQNMNSLTSGGTNYGEQIFMRLGTTNEYLLATKRLVGSIEAKMDLINQQLSRL